MTLKQFFQLAGGFLVALIFYSTPLIGIIKWPFVIISAILGVALAFLPLEERPLERWIFAFFKAIYTPTEFSWQKTQASPKFFQDEVGPIQEIPALNPPLSKLEGAERGFLATLGNIFTTNSTTSVTDRPQVSIPIPVPIKIVAPNTQRLVVEEKPKEVLTSTPQISTQTVSPTTVGNEFISTRTAIFSMDAAPPNPPSTPNVVVGQVVDNNRKIVEGAIMEIRDAMGRPVRALRSNKLGHFVTVTPLENGRYEIATEKDGYEFTPVSFEVAGNVVPPILVQGHQMVQ